MEFSNPLPPSNYAHQTSQEDSQPLTNDDFRKLMMTPRVGGPTPSSKVYQKQASVTENEEQKSSTDERKKRKLYYAKLKKIEDEKKKELDSKYRDRAKERREGKANEETSESNIFALIADITNGSTQAEKRKKMIEESKFLGGDMEHTHLVKGLDYALLDKVRAEINSQETHDEDLEAVVENPEDIELDEDQGEEAELRGRLAKNIYRVLFKTKLPQKNEMFAPGRMAYVVDLEDDFPESDIPTTAIRSKADCPTQTETTTLTTNDIVINKLTQILSYLRQGRRDKKKRKEKEKAEAGTKELMKPKDDVEGGREDRGNRHTSYFEKPDDRSDMEKISEKERKESASQFLKGLSKQYAEKWNEMDAKKGEKEMKAKQGKTNKRKPAVDSYAECYPGMDEAADAIDDSDDEADYTKMDMGNKKGPVNRWDFENDEQYQEYMSKKEALPKAAFQYGVKMSDGRKTRRAGPKDEKAALDREWQQIQSLMAKRSSGGSASKRAKY
ncbi:IK [Bugula neritina]|uniref:IK n=1 Tax=Bugula neritina TaxID=10212 RepID=A0A7J7JZE5_BUGNE|nr:IK [Bugula neritina]